MGHPAKGLQPLHHAKQTLTRARAKLKGQGEPKRGVLRFIPDGSGVDRWMPIDTNGIVMDAFPNHYRKVWIAECERLGLEAEFKEATDAKP